MQEPNDLIAVIAIGWVYFFDAFGCSAKPENKSRLSCGARLSRLALRLGDNKMNEQIVAFPDKITGDPIDLRRVLDTLPAAIYMTNADGFVTYYNQTAADIAGRTPQIGKDKWCVGWRLYDKDGQPLALEDCPMAVALREKRAIRDTEIVIERPDGQRIPAMPFPTPIFDHDGKFSGALNMLIDLRELKHAQQFAVARMQDQIALYRFVDEIYRAKSSKEVYEAALDAITSVLNCSRAAILLFDDQNVMRFSSSRGLSDGYQQAVEGHSPWSATDKDPQPIFIKDIAETGESEELKNIIKKEGITAIAFIPLMANGALAGKFMTYHRTAHDFTHDEKEMAITIARQLGFSIAQMQMERERKQGEDRHKFMGAIIESSRDAIISKNLNGEILSWNRGAERLFGHTANEAIGKHISILIPDNLISEETEIISRIKRGEQVEHYETTRRRKDGSTMDISLTVSPVKNANGIIIGASKIARDVSERKRADAHKLLLLHELNHRVKNTLATVQSLATQTLSNTTLSADARDIFDARLTALSRAHDVLTDQSWEGANLQDIVSRAMQAFKAGERIVIDGQPVWLSPKQVLALAMALHELATNASKYGSLSNADGIIKINWDVQRDSRGRRQLELIWVESGGPAVSPPTRKGFGTRLVERNLANELDGKVLLDYRPEGVICTISSRLD